MRADLGKQKNAVQQQLGERKCDRKDPTDTKVSKEGGFKCWGWSPQWRISQPMENPPKEQSQVGAAAMRGTYRWGRRSQGAATHGNMCRNSTLPKGVPMVWTHLGAVFEKPQPFSSVQFWDIIP